MKKVMFTKHVKEFGLDQIIEGLKRIGLDGADLCTRPGFPVNPDNCEKAMPAAAKQFADAGLSIEICTTPGDFTDPAMDYAERLFASCGEAGVSRIKLGYWRLKEGDSYWKTLDDVRRHMAGFAKLAEKHAVRAVTHTHCGMDMGLNASAAMRIVEGLDPKSAGVFLDTGHLSLVGEPLPMAIDMCWDYLACFALKELVWSRLPGDLAAEPRVRVVPFGLGQVDWSALAREFKRCGYDEAVSFHGEYSYPPEAVMSQCHVDKILFEKVMAETEIASE